MDKQLIYAGTEPQRIDKYLAKQFPDVTRRFIQQQIEMGNVLVGGKAARRDYQLKTGDVISVSLDDMPAGISLEPQAEVNFSVLFHNEDFAVIDKPAGLTVHPSATQPKDTLANGLLHHFPGIINVGEDPLRPGIVHRLDKDTSGLMVIALNQKSFEYLKNLFQIRAIEKKYRAMVWGHPKDKEGVIKSYIGRSKTNPLKQASVQDPAKVSNAKEAVTYYKVAEEYADRSLVEAVPKTGRMHQIRIHFYGLGHPLVGDKKYQTKEVKAKNMPYSRHLLHACELSFTGQDGQEYHFTSPLPPEFSV